ncbi:Methyltransferase domain-containing protein [Kaistia soli DSM 19436]|uniref:Methyltransferase domain-containing protein n=1 Tax=Kaistia soli DSM 19436 TaxID=1122133 RepID=A0A1M4WTM1_9HYPH|nr:class I SAM-dependent methyltransferase [Kaistia soli]SHE84545.1 Methyltransferase domain-containing protein [Kaistia soli DSM 19436]
MLVTAFPPDGAPPLPDMAESYDAYFSSGLYQSRYPRPNPRTMRFLRRALPVGGRLLDYGAGEGRYCLALARERNAEIVAVDISPVAREHLTAAVATAGLASHISVVDASGIDYRRLVDETGRFDVALLGFGVLGHVAGRANRLALLKELRRNLAPDGRLILGLPNAKRRFREAQADASARAGLEAGDIRYVRDAGKDKIALFYHLYRRDEIVAELAEAGFAIEHMTSESLLPEYAVTHHPFVGWIDDRLSGMLPVDWGYGYLVVAVARR